MRLLVIDAGAHALDFVLRAAEAGHDVKWFKRWTVQNEHCGRGLVPCVNDFMPWLRWANLIFLTDNTRYLRNIDALRKEESIPIVGPTEGTALWEIDRVIGLNILKQHHVEVPAYKEFTDYDAAIAYVKKEGRRFVSKPCGIIEDKALSYVSECPEDMIFMLERWKKLGKHKAPFILQEFVAGVEMAVGGWFGPGGFNEGWCENFEFKKFMNDNLGVATGEQGTVLRYVKNSKLANKMLLPLTEALEAHHYCGYIDVNCIIDDQGQAWPLEFTTRPGWPTFNIQQPLHEGDCVEWLLELAEGTDSRRIIYDRVAVGVVMSIPDYPYSHLTRKEVVGVPIYGIRPKLKHHIHPCSMMLGDKIPCEENGTIVYRPMLVTAGDYVLIMSATGETVKETALTVYRRLKTLTVPNSPMYRTDIGKRLAKELPKLQTHGYAMGMRYSQD